MGRKVYVSFRCEPDLDRRVRVEAAMRDMNRTKFIVTALREKLERIDQELLDRIESESEHEQ